MADAGGGTVEVRPVPFDDPAAVALVRAQRAELAERYDDPRRLAGRPLDPENFVPPRGAFVVAWEGDRPVACGGLQPGERSGVAEIKRMYTATEARGRGLGLVVLAALEAEAAQLGYRVIELETGVLQPEAMALYERSGYERVANYGRYAGRDDSVCYRKEL